MKYCKLRLNRSWFGICKSFCLEMNTMALYELYLKLVDVVLQEMRSAEVTEDRLQLLNKITGAFQPSVLTALVGVSGAG